MDDGLAFAGEAKDLVEAIGVAASVVLPKSTNPVMQNLLLSTGEGGSLEATGMDGEVWVRSKVSAAEVSSPGAVLVNAQRFMQILREMSGERIRVSAEEKCCKVLTDESSFEVAIDDPNDFPEFPKWPDKPPIPFASSDFSDMIRRTVFAAHQERTRYAMQGVLLEIKKGKNSVNMVSTDGKRLALCERELADKQKSSVHVVIPTKALSTLRSVLGEEGSCEACVDDQKIHMRSGGAQVSARLIEGSFPPYEDVVPKDHDKKFTLPKESFASAVRRASLLGTRDSAAVRFTFSSSGLEMTTRVPEIGSSRVAFAFDYPHAELSVGFNPMYLLDALKVVKSEEFVLELKDSQNAAIIKEEAAGFTYLLMPLNLG